MNKNKKIRKMKMRVQKTSKMPSKKNNKQMCLKKNLNSRRHDPFNQIQNKKMIINKYGEILNEVT